MTKNLKLSFILIAIYAGIIIAWRTLTSFFSGVGLNLVALLAILAIILTICMSDKFTFNRIKDLFFLAVLFAILELIVYFGIEFVIVDVSHVANFLVFQNVISIFSLIYFAYITFRFITEFKGIKIGFVEFILGNRHIHRVPKKAIELTNGTLEEKPNRMPEKQETEIKSETKEEE